MECRRGLAMKILSVRLSVRLSVCQKRALWQNSIKICPYERPFSLVFREKRMVGGATSCTRKFGTTGPRWSEIADFWTVIVCSTSAVKPNEKSSINTNRKSTTRFPMSLRWSSYTLPLTLPKGGSKPQIGRFSSEIALLLKKVCCKVSLYENCQRKVVGHSLA